MLVCKPLLLIAAITSALSMQAAAQSSGAGAVFMMTNDADRNEIVAYNRAADGTLSNPTRYDTQGRGSGGVTDPLSSQGALALSDDHSLLFAVNAGSGTVSVFRVRRGELSFVDKAPTGGSEPVAVTQSRNLVFVLNAAGRGNIVGFRLELNGKLTRIKNSSAFLTANGSGGASLSVSPGGEFLSVTERAPNNVDTFRINLDGSLSPIVVNASAGTGAFAAVFSSTGNIIVAETGPANVSRSSTASSYSVSGNGILTVVSRSVPTFGDGNCWAVITPNGKWIYFSNSASSSISGFGIGKTGVLTPIAGTVLATKQTGTTNLDMAITFDGKYLYTLNSGSGNISAFSIQPDGTLITVGDFGTLPQSGGINGIAAY